jgi:hypothetical protein
VIDRRAVREYRDLILLRVRPIHIGIGLCIVAVGVTSPGQVRHVTAAASSDETHVRSGLVRIVDASTNSPWRSECDIDYCGVESIVDMRVSPEVVDGRKTVVLSIAFNYRTSKKDSGDVLASVQRRSTGEIVNLSPGRFPIRSTRGSSTQLSWSTRLVPDAQGYQFTVYVYPEDGDRDGRVTVSGRRFSSSLDFTP